jgi:hypothetical protein
MSAAFQCHNLGAIRPVQLRQLVDLKFEVKVSLTKLMVENEFDLAIVLDAPFTKKFRHGSENLVAGKVQVQVFCVDDSQPLW